MCVRTFRSWLRGLEATPRICYNPTRQACVASFPPSSSFLIPEHLLASPLAFSGFISLFSGVLSGYHVGSLWEMCLFVSSGNVSPLEQRKKCEDGSWQSIANASVKPNLRETDALMRVCSLLHGDLDRLLCIWNSIRFRKLKIILSFAHFLPWIWTKLDFPQAPDVCV